MTNVAGTVLHGHKLRAEGAAYNEFRKLARPFSGGVGGEGRALCGCGELSEILPSSPARKQWHRDHKAAVRSGTSLNRNLQPESENQP